MCFVNISSAVASRGVSMRQRSINLSSRHLENKNQFDERLSIFDFFLLSRPVDNSRKSFRTFGKFRIPQTSVFGHSIIVNKASFTANHLYRIHHLRYDSINAKKNTKKSNKTATYRLVNVSYQNSFSRWTFSTSV